MKNNEWKISFKKRFVAFAVKVILLANKLPKTPAGFAIASQLVKSGTSIGANFTEAQDASSLKDFVQKLSISLREARETNYWLIVIKETNLIPQTYMQVELQEVDELTAILISSIKKSKEKIT
jgi:four helix bundle protein